MSIGKRRNRISKHLKNVFISGLFKDTSTLITGTLIAQLIPILLQPFLRRFYPPEVFGTYAVYLSLVGILIMISSFKYELAIVLPKKNKLGANVLFLAQFCNVAFNILLFIIILIFSDPLVKYLNISPEYKLFLYFVPLGVFLYSLYTSINYWLIRNISFIAVSTNKIVRRGFEGATQSLFVVLKKNTGLLWGDIIGHIANIISGTIQMVKNDFSLKYISLNKILYVGKKYSEFPKYNLIPGFLSACSFLLPAIFINKFYSSEETGYFDLTKLLLSIPLALVATSLSNVLLQRITEKYNVGRSIIKDILPIGGIILGIIIVEISVITLFAEELFTFFFGGDWLISAQISKVLVWSFSFNFLIASFSSLFVSLRKIKIYSIWQIVYFIAIMSLVFFKERSFTNFLKIYVQLEVLCYAIALLLTILIIIKYESKIRNKQ